LGFGVSPLHELALHYLLVVHLLQNVVLAEWAPLLLVLSLPPALAEALSRPPVTRTLTHPLVALPLWLADYPVWHIPPPYPPPPARPTAALARDLRGLAHPAAVRHGASAAAHASPPRASDVSRHGHPDVVAPRAGRTAPPLGGRTRDLRFCRVRARRAHRARP